MSNRPRTDGVLIQSGLQGSSGGIALRGARCVTVMLVGWNVSSCQHNMVHDGATLRLKTQRINSLIGGRKKEDKESGHGQGTGGDQPSPHAQREGLIGVILLLLLSDDPGHEPRETASSDQDRDPILPRHVGKLRQHGVNQEADGSLSGRPILGGRRSRRKHV